MGMISESLSGNETGSANQLNQGAINAIQSVQTPSIAKMRIKLAQLVQQGQLSPEAAQTFLQQASAYESIDPRAREAELGALGQLQGVVDERGLDPQARAALEQAKQQMGAEERGQREAILQNAAARGISGSGIELASLMGGQQGSATRLANQGFQSAADANARKMAALSQVGQLSGQMTAEDQRKAEAQNAINQFNTANRQNVENTNVASRNAAAASNLAEKQRISDTNTQTKNEQESFNKNLYQQDFGNQMNKAQALANASLGASGNYLGIAEHKTKASDKWSDEALKVGIEDVDPKDFMDGLKGYSYEYKDEKHGEGPQVGVMAQDLEKVAPQAVNDTPQGKTVDFTKVGGPILAALASLNDRLNELEGSENASG